MIYYQVSPSTDHLLKLQESSAPQFCRHKEEAVEVWNTGSNLTCISSPAPLHMKTRQQWCRNDTWTILPCASIFVIGGLSFHGLLIALTVLPPNFDTGNDYSDITRETYVCISHGTVYLISSPNDFDMMLVHEILPRHSLKDVISPFQNVSSFSRQFQPIKTGLHRGTEVIH